MSEISHDLSLRWTFHYNIYIYWSWGGNQYHFCLVQSADQILTVKLQRSHQFKWIDISCTMVGNRWTEALDLGSKPVRTYQQDISTILRILMLHSGFRKMSLSFTVWCVTSELFRQWLTSFRICIDSWVVSNQYQICLVLSSNWIPSIKLFPVFLNWKTQIWTPYIIYVVSNYFK